MLSGLYNTEPKRCPQALMEGRKKNNISVKPSKPVDIPTGHSPNPSIHGNKKKKEQEQKSEQYFHSFYLGPVWKLKRIFRQYNIPVHLKPVNTLWQKLVHPNAKIPSYKQSNVVCCMHCNCNEQYIGETKLPVPASQSQLKWTWVCSTPLFEGHKPLLRG